MSERAIHVGGINQAITAVVLIVPGSGATDRDGNNPPGVSASPYRLLACLGSGRGCAATPSLYDAESLKKRVSPELHKVT